MCDPFKKDNYVYYGGGKAQFNIPLGWKVLQNPVPKEIETSLAIPDMVKIALATPISSPRISEIAHEDSKVAMIVDDCVRPTPISQILPTILEELQAGGAKDENIDIVVALGTHQAASPNSLAERFGEAILKKYRVIQHDCHAGDLATIGHLSTGGEVRINPIVARADIKIGIGSIFPHPMNGFGGGAKILMPGVANFEAVKEHHLFFATHPDCYIGNVETNPFYREVCRVAEMAQLTFIVNCIFNSHEKVVDVVAGHFQKAHLAGIETSKRLYALSLNEQADITITSSYPFLEGPQIIKPIIPASLLATKPGGSVIVMTTCREKLPEPMLDAFDAIYSKHRTHTGKFAVDTFKSSKLFVEGSIDFNCAIYYTLLCVDRNRITMVSRDLDERSINRLGFRYAISMEEAIEQTSKIWPKATVNIFPIGGLFLPLTKKPWSN